MRRPCPRTADPAERSIRMIKTTLTRVTRSAVFAGVFAGVSAGMFAGVSAAHAPGAGDTFAIRAARVHVGDGTVIENGIVPRPNVQQRPIVCLRRNQLC